MAELTPPKHKAIAALLACRTIGQAAKVAEVAERTLTRWLADPDFKAALAAARRGVFAAAVDGLRQAATEAVETLREVLADKEASAAVRVQAASAILGHAFRAVELADVTERLDRLEEAAADAPRTH